MIQAQNIKSQGSQSQSNRMQGGRMQQGSWRNWFQDEGGGRRSLLRQTTSEQMSSYPASYFGPLSTFFWDMDRMFNNTFRSMGLPVMDDTSGMQMFRPNIDIASNDDEYLITVEVPGVEEKNIRLDISAGLLIISGEKQQEVNESRGDTELTERTYGTFQRTLSLPDDVDIENIEARFRNGVLTIVCPRARQSRPQHRQIPINREGEGARAASNENRRPQAGQEPRKAA